MASVEGIRVESDESGFELHIIVDEWPQDGGSGLMILNVQAVAEELYDAVKRGIGPWLAERDAALAEYRAAGGHPMCPDEDGHCQYGRDDSCPQIDPDRVPWEALIDAGDVARKVAKGE